MVNYFLLLSLASIIVLGAQAAPLPYQSQQFLHILNPYPNKPRLTFRRDGTFKLTVFSDLHFGENPWDTWGPEQDASSTRLMRHLLKEEKPDYVAITGDLITGENTFKENATTLIDQLTLPLREARVPFSTCHGNHDNAINITHIEEIERERTISPLSYTRLSPPGVGGQSGPGNYWVPIYAHAWAPAPSLILWFFDSRSSVYNNGTQLDDFVDPSVAQWVKSETQIMKRAWGPSTNRAALAFVHIPPHITEDLQDNLDPENNPGLNDDTLGGQGSIQSTQAGVAPGQDTPFWESIGSIENLHAVVSGHDHGNEWCARDITQDVVFCFAKHTGYGGYDHGWGHGVRNIVFSSPDPRIPVRTWIRMEEGEIKAEIVLDESYKR